MGRKTYEIYAATWPTREGAYPELINSMPKYVASTTLESPTWRNTTVLEGDLATSVQALKDSPGTVILMHGFGPVAKSLARAGLLDELHLWWNPAFAGFGDPEDLLLSPGLNIDLRHRATRTLSNGVVVVSYAFQAAE